MEYKTERCDVLVIGGGIAGLSCAVSVKEQCPELDVLVAEKNFAGYSGKANRGGGVLQYFDPERIDPWEFVKFHAEKIGAYLGDQELMAEYVAMNKGMLDKLTSWGAVLPKREDGSYRVFPTGPMTAMIATDLDITLNIRKTAEKLGVRFVDKTALIDLLTDDGGVTGAAVFSILDGTPMVIRAGETVLSAPCGAAGAATASRQLTGQARSSGTWNSATSPSWRGSGATMKWCTAKTSCTTRRMSILQRIL